MCVLNSIAFLERITKPWSKYEGKTIEIKCQVVKYYWRKVATRHNWLSPAIDLH
jgi:hypothetical protein